MLNNEIVRSHSLGMNKLPLEKRVQILSMLCEGTSMRATSRICDVSINTVTKLLVDAGEACAAFHDEVVRGVKAKKIQCGEIWSFNHAKAKNVTTAKAASAWSGDVWTWTALDSDSNLIVSFLLGGRDSEYAMTFIDDLRQRLANRLQLSTDGRRAYLTAVDEPFGTDIDYAMLVKLYGEAPEAESRYSATQRVGARKERIAGNSNKFDVLMSHEDHNNLSFRMHTRRFAHLANTHSKKFENHGHMVALYVVWHNFVRASSAVRMPPAIAAGIATRPMTMEEIIGLIDAAKA